MVALQVLEGKAEDFRELVRVSGSKLSSSGWPMPISGVATDWWAPPSGASEMPEGVATRRKRAPW